MWTHTPFLRRWAPWSANREVFHLLLHWNNHEIDHRYVACTDGHPCGQSMMVQSLRTTEVNGEGMSCLSRSHYHCPHGSPQQQPSPVPLPGTPKRVGLWGAVWCVKSSDVSFTLMFKVTRWLFKVVISNKITFFELTVALSLSPGTTPG